MVAITSIPSLASLNFNYDIESDNYWLFVGDWTDYLNKHLVESDKWKEVDSSNVRRIFKREQADVQCKDGKWRVSLSAVIGFAYTYKNSIGSCQSVVKEIESKLLENMTTHKKESQSEMKDLPIQNVLELYKLVAKSNIGGKKIQDLLLPGVHIENRKIVTLVEAHKDNFSESEWAKICLFEWHFSQVNYVCDMAYETQLKERFNFYLQCQEAERLASMIQIQGKDIAHKNMIRRDYGEAIHGVQIYGKVAHIPGKLDAALFESVRGSLSVSSLIATGCHISCQHNTGIHVYLEVSGNITNLDERVELVKYQIKNTLDQHNDECREIVIFQTGSFSDFQTKDKNEIQRFHLCDAINSRSIDNKIVKRVILQCDGDDEIELACDTCFPETDEPALHWKDLNLIQEWFLYVPLCLQILLGVFINKVSLKRSGDKQGFLISKIICLYSVFERLLNLQNRQYLGVVQELNTDELVFNFHNVGTVFSITSETGITQSLKTAEKRLRQYSDNDLCYFNTYLKRYPIQYESISGRKEENISLQNCYLAFCVDNLVRFTFKQDRERSEARSQQIATLPMTLKGIPKDTMLSESWHDDQICDGTELCPCKKENELTKNSVQTVLLEPTVDEKRVLEKFRAFMTWNWTTMWLQTSGYQKLNTLFQEATEYAKENPPQPSDIAAPTRCCDKDETNYNDDTIDLDLSLSSLKLANTQELDSLDLSMRSLKLDESEGSDNSSGSTSDESDESDSVSGSSDINPDTSYESDTGSEGSITYSETELDTSLLPVRIPELVRSPEVTSDDLTANNFTNDSAAIDSETSTEQVVMTTKETRECLETEEENNHNQLDEDPSKSHSQSTEGHSEKVLKFGFSVYQPPPMICRHPPPAIGRDDSITKLREVLDEVLIKSGNNNSSVLQNSRILFAPDQKIGSNLLKLLEQDPKYRVFLPEFPLLHLRKSKITNLCIGYKEAGIVQLLMYMNDDEKEKDWVKLVEATHIEHATRNIKRLSLTFHLYSKQYTRQPTSCHTLCMFNTELINIKCSTSTM